MLKPKMNAAGSAKRTKRMTPTRVNILLGVLLVLSLGFGLHQSFALKRLQAVAGPEISQKALGSSQGRFFAFGLDRSGRGGEDDTEDNDTPAVAAGTESGSADGEKSAVGMAKSSQGKDVSGKESTGANSVLQVGAGNGKESAVGASGGSDSSKRRRTGGKAGGQSAKQEAERAQRTAKSNSLVVQAQDLMRTGQYDQAEALLQQSLEEDVQNQSAWQQMARLQHKMGYTEAEIDTYLQWMQASPADAAPYYKLASTYAALGRDDDARYYIGEYEARSGNEVTNYTLSASLYRQIEDREQEGRVLSQWLAAAPESVDAQQAWADYNRRTGGYDVALSQYEALAAVMPNNPMLYRQMGDIYRRVGDYAQAQSNYEAALNLRPSDIDTLGRLATVHMQNGDYEGALGAYSEIIALEPGSNAAENAQRYINNIEQQLQYSQTVSGN